LATRTTTPRVSRPSRASACRAFRDARGAG
jgi:hypothetical protein